MSRFSFKFSDPASVGVNLDEGSRVEFSSDESMSSSPLRRSSTQELTSSVRSSTRAPRTPGKKKKLARSYTTGSSPPQTSALDDLENFAKALKKTSPEALAFALGGRPQKGKGRTPASA